MLAASRCRSMGNRRTPVGIARGGEVLPRTTSCPRSGWRLDLWLSCALMLPIDYRKANKPASGSAFKIALKPALMADVPATTMSPDCRVGSSAWPFWIALTSNLAAAASRWPHAERAPSNQKSSSKPPAMAISCSSEVLPLIG